MSDTYHVFMIDLYRKKTNFSAIQPSFQGATEKKSFFIFLSYYNIHYSFLQELSNDFLKKIFPDSKKGTNRQLCWQPFLSDTAI